MASKLNIDDILKEEDTSSDLSVDISFTCQDILKEKENIESDDDDIGDPFEDEEPQDQISDTKPSKVSDTLKSRSTFEVGRQQSTTNVEARRAFRIKDTLLKQETLSKSMTYVHLSLVSSAFDPSNKNAKGVGLPICIHSTSSKYLAIGTTLANIALFEVGSRDYKVLKDTEMKQVIVGNPISVVMSEDSKWLVAGFEGGGIGLWDLASLSLVKTVPSIVAGSPTIIKLLFWKGNTDFLSLDSAGNVILHTIEKYVWTSIRSRRLFSSAVTPYYDAKVNRLENGKIVLALANVDFIFLINLEPAIEIITKIGRPSNISQSKIPNIELGKTRSMDVTTDVVAISWGKSIYIYRYNSMNRPDKVYELEREYEWSEPIFCLQMISLNILLVIDNKNTFKLLNVTQDINKNAIKHEMTLDFDLTPQRIMKDKSGDFIKNFTNRVSKCTSDFKEIFLLTKGAVTRGRLHSWTDFIRYLIKEKEWDQILKASIEIFFGRLDIFAEKVVITPNTVLLFNELLVVYLKSRLDDLTDRQFTTLQARQQRQQIVDTVIEFCIELQLTDNLFNRIFQILNNQYSLSEEFMECLGPFIELDLIKVIPNKPLLRIILEYYALHRIELVDKLISNLRYDSIDYLATIQVCSRSKLYPSLMYISQLFGDFLEPLNQIITDCRMLSDDGYSDQKLRLYESLIYKFVWSTTNGKTVTGVRLTREIQESGIKKVFVWYLDGENSEYLIGENSKDYFMGLAEMLTQETVCGISDTIVGRVDLLGYVMEKMSQTLQKLGKEQYHQDFSECIITIGKVWDLNKAMLAYCLEHFKVSVDISLLAKFINKNFNIITDLQVWRTASSKFPLEIQGQVLCRQDNYKKAITIYQNLKDEAAQKRLFQFTPQQPFLKYLSDFLKLNVDMSASCLYQRFCAQTIDETVSTLPDDIFKYECIRKLIMLDLSNDIRWRQSTALFYLESLCKYRKEKRVLYELKRRDFDIIKSLAIVSKYKLKWCEAFLHESNLEFQQALMMYGKIYQKIFKEEFKQVLRFVFINGRELKRVFDDILRVVRKLENSQKQVEEVFRIVFSNLTEEGSKKGKGIVAKQISDISKKKGDLQRQFINVFRNIVQQTLRMASNSLSIIKIKSLVEEYKLVFQQPLLFNLYTETLVVLSRDLNITLDTERIMFGDMNDMFKQVMRVKSTVISGGQFCGICRETLSGCNTSVFSCGCCVHEMCCPANPEECPVCKLRKQQSSSNEKILKMLKPNFPSGKKDLRKSSIVSDSGYTYQFLSSDASISKQSDQIVDMLMENLMLREPEHL